MDPEALRPGPEAESEAASYSRSSGDADAEEEDDIVDEDAIAQQESPLGRGPAAEEERKGQARYQTRYSFISNTTHSLTAK